MKTPLSFFLLLCICLFSGLPLQAQFNNQKFITYTTENGLTDNYVVKVLSDTKGFVWVATRNGVSRFDGLKFTNYRNSNGLRSAWITDLALDKRGTVWLSTEWGVCYYDATADSFKYVNKMNEMVVLYKGPLLLQGDDLWVAAENGLRKINTVSKRVEVSVAAPIPDPQCIAADAAGRIWIGTRGNGFYVYNAATNKCSVVHLSPLPKDAHLMNFYSDASGFWCATSEGLFLIKNDKEGILFRQPPDANTASIDALTFITPFQPLTGDSVFICGTYNYRIAFFNKNSRKFTQVFSGSSAQMHGIPASPLHDAISTKKVLWLGSDKGLTMLNLQRQDYTSFLLSGDKDFEKAIVKKILPATENKNWLLLNNPAGIALYNNTTNNIEQVWKGVATNRQYKTALPFSTNLFLLLHQNGVDEFSSTKGIRSIYYTTKGSFYGADIDKQDNLWIGTDAGLTQYNLKTKKITEYECHFQGTEVENNSFLLPFYVKNVCADDKGTIWMVSPKYGLFSFNTTTKEFTPHRQVSSKAYEVKNRCGDLEFDSNGNLWIASNAGLTKFDTARRTFTNYSQQEGLQSSYVYSIAVDNNNNIIGRGNTGVFYFEQHKKKFTNYSVPIQMSSSLLEQEVCLVNGQSIVGFEGGFTTYNTIKNNTASLPVFITGVSLRHQKLPLPLPNEGHPIEFSYGQNVLQIDFACVNYTEADDITYRYKLNGGSNQWINAGAQRSVLFTELAPGNYSFAVIAVAPNGASSKQPATFYFTVHPPFWQQAWFLTLLVAIAGISLWLLYRRRIKNIRQQQQQKLKQQQLEIEAYQQRLELEKLSAFFSGSLLNKRTTQEVLDSVANDLIGRLGFENCMMYLWNEERQLLIQQGGYGLKGAINSLPDDAKYHLQKGQGIVGAAVSNGEAIMVNDTSKDSRYISADGMISQSELCVPLITNNRVLGAINIEQSQKNFFTHYHLQIVTTIAALVASRIEAIQLTAARYQKEIELESAARRITETELAMLRSQMNPHFIFNSLNSIQKYIWESRQEDAAEYLTKFARLIRSVLENSEAKLVSLQKELMSLKLYVELEHRRSNQKFDYSISVDESLDVTNILVPPLLLQPYIENAIWHGLNPKKMHGELFISISQNEKTLYCLIEDNGIGREASMKLKASHHKSMGLNISLQRIQLMQKDAGIEAKITVTDKILNEEPAGTKIEIILPLILANA